MGHHYRCPSFEEALQVLHDDALVVGIQCVGGFVEEDEFRVLVHGAGDEYALFLSLAQSVPFLAYPGVVSQWQSLDESVYVCHFRRMPQAFLVDVLHPGGDVAGNAVREDEPVLHHHAAPFAPLADAEVLQRGVAQQYLSACRRIES